MVQDNDSTEIMNPPFDISTFNDYMSLFDWPMEPLEIASSQSTDKASPSQTPSPKSTKTGSNFGPQRRGRPKIPDDDDGEAASKERRKFQVRQAQRAYRSRKEEQLTTLSRRVAELEQKLLIVRGLYLSTHAAVTSTGLLNPSLKLLHDNLQLLLANTDIQVPAVALNLNTDSLQFTPGESYPLQSSDMFIGQDITPGLIPEKAYEKIL